MVSSAYKDAAIVTAQDILSDAFPNRSRGFPNFISRWVMQGHDRLNPAKSLVWVSVSRIEQHGRYNSGPTTMFEAANVISPARFAIIYELGRCGIRVMPTVQYLSADRLCKPSRGQVLRMRPTTGPRTWTLSLSYRWELDIIAFWEEGPHRDILRAELSALVLRKPALVADWPDYQSNLEALFIMADREEAGRSCYALQRLKPTDNNPHVHNIKRSTCRDHDQ